MADEHEKHDAAHPVAKGHDAAAHDAAAHDAAGHDAHAAEHAHGHDPLEAGHLIGHVKDTDHFEFPRVLGGKVAIPQPFQLEKPIMLKVGFAPIDERIEALDLKVTKFMVLEVVAALLVIGITTFVATRVRRTGAPKGRLVNAIEAMVVFIRNEVARPAIGGHDADHFMPYLLTVFFFIVTCNLLGLVPWAGSATGALATTGALALLTFATVIFSGMAKLGPVGFWAGQVPHMELPLLLWPLKIGIFFIEVAGLCIKHFILAMRLLANMMAGHLVLAVILAFIAASSTNMVWYAVTPASVFGAVALSLLELFVAFLQAYIFTFLSALFIGMAVHPH